MTEFPIGSLVRHSSGFVATVSDRFPDTDMCVLYDAARDKFIQATDGQLRRINTRGETYR